MTEHKTCKGCKWNNYPYCNGLILHNGEYMKIDDKKPSFECGLKEDISITDLSIVKKSELELKINELEQRIAELETKEVKTDG